MECREVRQLAEAFVSDQLPVETTRAVVAHLDRCPACRAEIEGLRRLRAATRSAFVNAAGLAPRPAFATELGERLQSPGNSAAAPTARPRWLAIAASILILAGLGWGWREWTTHRSRLLADAVGDHRFCALTFKLAEQPIPLEEAARRYGGIYARLEQLQPSTSTLSGGPLQIVNRHSCVFNGRRFAHIVMRYRNETVSLLIADSDAREQGTSADRTPVALPVTDGFNVASFRGGRHAVFVVSALSADDVREVTLAMGKSVVEVLNGA